MQIHLNVFFVCERFLVVESIHHRIDGEIPATLFRHDHIDVLKHFPTHVLGHPVEMGDAQIGEDAGNQRTHAVAIADLFVKGSGRSADLFLALPVLIVANVVHHELPDAPTGLFQVPALEMRGQFAGVLHRQSYHLRDELQGISDRGIGLDQNVPTFGPGDKPLVP